MPYNGPAIKGVCVPAIGGVARFLESGYNADRKQVSYHLIVILLTALVQYRAVPRRSEAKAGVQVDNGAGNLSWYRI
jgi:hypothetical protein